MKKQPKISKFTRLPHQPKRGALPGILDWTKIDSMLHIQCTGEEIASILDISYDTLERCCRRDKKMKFAEYSTMKRQGGKASLRRKQWAMADKNVAMAIWLGKVMLGQKETQEIDFGKNSLNAIGKMAGTVLILPGNGRDVSVTETTKPAEPEGEKLPSLDDLDPEA
jgi:hypothetical protein